MAATDSIPIQSRPIQSTPPATEQPPKQNPHRNNLNFLRVVLATLVILSHSPEIVDGNRHREILTRLFHTISFGEFAVDGFFILSGYLIVQSWLRSKTQSDYLKKRVLRIYPGYLVASLISAFVVGPLGAANAGQYLAQMHYKNFIKYLILLHGPQTPPTFVGLPYPVVNGAMWTIFYEFECYLLVMALGLLGLFRQRGIIAVCLLGALLMEVYTARYGLPLRFNNILIGDVSAWPHFLTFFLAGGCFYLYKDRIVYSPRGAWIALILLTVALFHHLTALAALPVCGAYLLLYVGLKPGGPFARVGERHDISYGLYLYAWPLQILLAWYFRGINPWLMFVLVLGSGSFLAFLSWRFVEKPALLLKKRVTASAA